MCSTFFASDFMQQNPATSRETTSWEVHIFPERPVVISHPIWTIRLHKSLKHFHFFYSTESVLNMPLVNFKANEQLKEFEDDVRDVHHIPHGIW